MKRNLFSLFSFVLHFRVMYTILENKGSGFDITFTAALVVV